MMLRNPLIVLLLVASMWQVPKSHAQTGHAPILEDSGTEYVTAVSDWHPTSGEAEAECCDALESQIEDVSSDIEDNGGTVVAVTTFGMDVEEREVDDYIEFQATQEAEIEWVNHSEGSNVLNTTLIDVPKIVEQRLSDYMRSRQPCNSSQLPRICFLSVASMNLDVIDFSGQGVRSLFLIF